MKLKYILPLIAFVSAQAQVHIDFESETGYTGLGVYDVWEESPIRTGAIAGNWAVTPNPDTEVNEIIGEVPNPSAYVLGAQRSRFGSNRMGVRIDLAEPFRLTSTPKYVHVMLLKPVAGRIMLVGLGSRTERKDQNPYCEQFWVVSTSAVEPGMWSDAVFPVKGVDGIDIRSLVLVPDMESPHNLTEDFLFYVDDIEVNNTPFPKVTCEYYPVVGGKAGSEMTRTDRVTSSISLTIGDETQTLPIEQQSNKKLYQDLTDKVFYAQTGQTLKPEIGYAQQWMHSYCYLDINNDGRFADDELMSYNGYSPDDSNYKNSKGEDVNRNPGAGQCGKMPDFTLPAAVTPGRYRMRLKLDWNSLDPAGNPGDAEGNNLINANAGMIADVMLNVCGQTIDINDFQLNGEVLAADGSKLSPYSAPYRQAFTIKVAPEKGFRNGGVDVKIGFNLDGEKRDKYGNVQYSELSVPETDFTDDLYTFPADTMRGNMLINGRMVEIGEGEISEVTATGKNAPATYDLQGRNVTKPSKGIYIIDGSKVYIR